jgi:hypothetical protein
MEVWITKYALTGGIIKKSEGHVNYDIDPSGNFISVPWENDLNGSEYFHKNEWFFSPSAAVAKAEDMRDKKIASLRKQIAKLEKMIFLV